MLFSRPKTFIIDPDTLADPRIQRFLALGLVQGKLLLPEPPAAKDPGDHRARRIKETVEQLRKLSGLSVKIDKKLDGRDALIAALKKHKATLLTTAAELKTACNGLPAVLLTEIYELFRPQVLPGAVLRVRINKKGKEKDEGIGYLEGGIKVVVENAADSVGSDVEVVVKGALETDAGQVVFARPRFVEVS